MKTLFVRLWRAWFYILAGVPVPFLFPFLAIALLFPKGYTFVFWVARNIWAPIILGGSGFYTKIRYAKPLPTGTSYVLVANHTSYIDPFVMLRVSKNPFVFVGKKELVKIPIFGYLYKRAAVMVNRSDKKSRWEVYGRVQKKLDLGYSVCIFPEVSYEDDTIFLNPSNGAHLKFPSTINSLLCRWCFMTASASTPGTPGLAIRVNCVCKPIQSSIRQRPWKNCPFFKKPFAMWSKRDYATIPRGANSKLLKLKNAWARWAELIAGFLPLLHAAHSRHFQLRPRGFH